MSATMPPSATAKLTSCAARKPLKLFDRPSTCRSAAMSHASLVVGIAIEAERLGERRPDAVGEQHDDQEQADSVEDLLDAGHVHAEHEHDIAQAFGECGKHERADDRSKQRSDAADDRPENDLDRTADAEDLLREKIVVEKRIE